MTNDNEKLSIVADHYKDTCEIVRSREKIRERRLMFVVMLTAAILIQIQSEQNLTQISEDIATKFISSSTFNNNIFILQYALWVFFAIFVQLYYQIDSLIERSYKYVHELEEIINNISGSEIIFREGKSYLSEYPTFSWWTWFFYKWIVPTSILLVSLVDLIRSFLLLGFSYDFPFKFVMMILVGSSTVLYLRLVHWKK